MDSERYWSVTIEARELYRHLQLLADDFGCVSLAPVFVRRRCFNDAPTAQAIENLIAQLVDADLLRVYESEGARYGFIPRFRQRLQRMSLKHPAPPAQMLAGDEDAREKFAKVQADSSKSIRSAAEPQRRATVGHPPKGSEENRKEEKRGEALRSRGKRATPLPEGFAISPRVKAWAAEKGYTTLDQHLEYFVGYARAKGATYADWDEALMNCIGRDWGDIRKNANGGSNSAPAAKLLPCGNCGAPLTGGWSDSEKGRVCSACYRGYMDGRWPQALNRTLVGHA